MSRVQRYAGGHLTGVMMSDLLTIGGLMVGLFAWASPAVWHPEFTSATVLALLVYFSVSHRLGTYAGAYSERFGLLAKRSQAWLAVVFVFLLMAYGFKLSAHFPRRAMLLVFVVTVPAMVIVQLLLQGLLRNFFGVRAKKQRAAILGTGHGARILAERIVTAPWMGVSLSGFYRLSQKGQSGVGSEAESFDILGNAIGVLGDSDSLLADVSGRQPTVDVVYVALPHDQRESVPEFVTALGDSTVSVYVVPSTFLTEFPGSHWVDANGLPLLSIYETPVQGASGYIKRLEDIVVAGMILSVLALPMLCIALAVRLTSKGPAIFKQKRYGLDGREIWVWKFRSMTVTDAGDKALAQATRDDPRVTKIGKLLRKTSLDELPQFINVLQGQMSVVGPRPHAVVHNEEFRQKVAGYMQRHKMKPGITGLAQVNGWRGETDTLEKMQRRVEYDLEYIQTWSVWLDLKIIVLTAYREFLGGRNAY